MFSDIIGNFLKNEDRLRLNLKSLIPIQQIIQTEIKGIIMANIIEKELDKAKNKMIKTIVVTIEKNTKNEEEKEIVTLTRDNVAIVEAMIRNDSAYIKSHKKGAHPTSKYNGSTAYWMGE